MSGKYGVDQVSVAMDNGSVVHILYVERVRKFLFDSGRAWWDIETMRRLARPGVCPIGNLAAIEIHPPEGSP